ncbi:leucine--tRNA ligase [Ethanoligenens harbinense]|uniref:Leucine--tRNA ligase n=1 Tax=Ethanoligenens harbinense (strain DSM 18485 / JCM 12961 / CGMCC 1.5033 / YUAN-3) TaxID=663278 RepID=E6U7Y2_ETHHY|nr:leucine--tRNA ligase [Ethanoligenens harbinense]ADU25914.1 leucyl-tRNA synthetase [Ethanoligenens harbinense YUAN-3]AVQ95069.1 leucine--tRNA ligase [Ethanoligenens harbinense YUAN-3]AYF37760.1 leucine--tRNA ligase [Ethanoligenens harbinense]AYF40481.1 leucine--tRNA ligase [Ethanoligenens harbinense]QCN91315.1 leucine--tRNA ligase [Ethanoligenens harbinense]
MHYDFAAIEKKWQKLWEETGVFHAKNDFSLPKFYALVEFPYPSGQGLHVGHPRSYTALDIVSRKRRLEGYNVLYPMGWDAFGLPTENFAIKNHIHPEIVTKNNVAHFKQQLQSLGLSFDWSREINTTDPLYYRWTQWIFLQLFKKGLAYKKEMRVNWCTSCKCVLANEEVVNGVCERCGSEVVHKVKSQWMLKITDYAQRLIDDLDGLDYIERVKTQQKNWIGRSTGAQVRFDTAAGDPLLIYTTRPDTIFGATYMVIAPEHPILEKWADKIENLDAVRAYQDEAAHKSDFERTEVQKDKTGVEIKGVRAVNPATGKEIPIFLSDYVLVTYGTGAIMAVPAHDERDFAFARTFGLPVVEVVAGGNVEQEAFTDCATGTMVNSGFLDGLTVEEAKEKIIAWLEETGRGEAKVNYKLRDWVFSRQRYWGEPIPLVYCEKCGWVPVPEDQLPLRLPEVASYEPTDNGESPLAAMTDWVNTVCPHCGGPARRETDTMPQWAGSSWYFLRYTDPHNGKALASPEALRYWLPVDWYNGGMEHTTLHLLYSRFWHKALFDLGIVPTSEPYQKRTSHGMILGENGEKMSKSRGNVVNPDEMVKAYGADTLRLYEMFIGDFEKAAPWSDTGIRGSKRFLERVWNLQEKLLPGDGYRPELESDLHKTIKKVTGDIESMKFNTAIAALMTLLNRFAKEGASRGEWRTFLLLLNPFAPHITEELWEVTGLGGRLNAQKWPTYDEAKCVDARVRIAVQVCGKLRGTVEMDADADQQTVQTAALELPRVQANVEGKQVVKVIFIKGKLINIVAK